MAGLGPAIHVFADCGNTRRGWPACAGHDDEGGAWVIVGEIGYKPVLPQVRQLRRAGTLGEEPMRRILLLLPLGLLAGCYYPYGPYDYDGYYAYRRPYPPPYPPQYQPPYTPGYPQETYRSSDQPGYQSYGQPGYAAPPQQTYQGYGQPTYLSPPPQDQGQSAYQPNNQSSYLPSPAPYQGQPQDYGAPQSSYSGASPANCGTPDEPKPCY